MLRRKPTAIVLTSEDVAAYELSRNASSAENAKSSAKNGGKSSGPTDPNDELKPLPGDKARAIRVGGLSREERIIGR